MDSMIDSHNHENISAIKEVLLSNALTPEQMINKLNALIDAEMIKDASDIDVGLIDACTELLWALHSKEMAGFISHKEENRVAILSKLQKRPIHRHALHYPLRRMVVVAVVIAFVLMGDIMFRSQRLEERQSSDGQQFIVQGNKDKPVLVDGSNANESAPDVKKLQTTDYEALADLLGFSPPKPMSLPAGWTLQLYDAHVLPEEKSILFVYIKESEGTSLSYEFTRYSNVEHIQQEFEQNGQGEKLVTDGGREVYVTQNIDRFLAVWMDGLDLYAIRGPITKAELLSIIDVVR